MAALAVVLIAVVVVLAFMLASVVARMRDLEARTAEQAHVQIPAAIEPKGPPRWHFNISFTEFVRALGDQLRIHLPESHHDRERLAEEATVAVSTIENILRGETNATLHSLYLVCQARRIRLSTLFGEVETKLQQAFELSTP
jgi:hypothetical protein